MTPSARPASGLRAALRAATLACAAALAACGATGAADADGAPRDVTMALRSFGDFPLALELVSETNTPAVAYYSSERADPNRKVAEDLLLGAVADAFADQGFWDYARPGRAPTAAAQEAGQRVVAVIEVVDGARAGWLAMRGGLSAEELGLFNELMAAFQQVYNATPGFQRVQDPSGSLLLGGGAQR